MSRRLAILAVSRDLWENLGTGYFAPSVYKEKVREALNLPDNCTVLDVSELWLWDRDQIAVKLECPDFPVVEEGDVIPQVSAVYDKHGKFVRWEGLIQCNHLSQVVCKPCEKEPTFVVDDATLEVISAMKAGYPIVWRHGDIRKVCLVCKKHLEAFDVGLAFEGIEICKECNKPAQASELLGTLTPNEIRAIRCTGAKTKDALETLATAKELHDCICDSATVVNMGCQCGGK